MILSPRCDVPPEDAGDEQTGAAAHAPDPDALYEIYWRYLWGDTSGDEQH